MDTLEGIRRVQRSVDHLMRLYKIPIDQREDLLQDAALDVCRYGYHSADLQARRVVVDHMRYLLGRYGERTAVTYAAELGDLATEDPSHSPEARYIASRMAPFLARLTPRERDVFRLKAQEWRQCEIASHMGVTESRICQIVRRALVRFQEEGHACHA